MDVIEMDWRHVLVASWPVPPAVVAARLPDGLAPDTVDGDAYLSVVPFVMADVRPRFVPRALGATFAELNLRTYVVPTDGGRPGIYFFNLDATDPLGVALARRVYGLPYYRATATVRRVDDRTYTFVSERTHPGVPGLSFDGTYRATGPAEPADPGSLDAFLLERYRFYVETDGGLRYADVAHPPWDLAPASATFETNDCFAANGFDHPDGDPHLAFSPGVPVTAGLPQSY